MTGFKSNFLTLILLLAFFSAVGQRGKIIKASTLTASASPNPLDPNKDGFITNPANVPSGFTSKGAYFVDEFEFPMFGIPKLGGDVTGDNIGKSCGITDLIPDSLAYSVYAVKKGNNLIFRFRVGDDNPSVESWTILLDTDGKVGTTGPDRDPNATADNPGFEIDITFIKRNNQGVLVYNIDGQDNCPSNPAIPLYSINSNFQISIADEVTCGDPDYFYDFFVPFTDLETAFGVNVNTGMRFVAVTNVSATCAMSGNIADVSGVDNTDPAYSSCVACAMLDLVENQCPTPIVDLAEGGPGFEKEKVTKPAIDTPIRAGQTWITGTTVESNIYVKLYIYPNLGTPSSPYWTPNANNYRETKEGYSTGNIWSFTLSSPLIGYDSIVARTQLTQSSVPCGSGGNNTSSTSITIVEPNDSPWAYPHPYSISEDPITPLVIVLDGDDPDDDILTYSIVPNSGPTHGTISGSGFNWNYTPFPNYFGPDQFSFNVSDGIYDSSNVISITVTPVNDPPVVTGSASPVVYTSIQSNLTIDNLIGVTDIDDVNIESATVSVTTNFLASEDALLFTNTPKITGIYSNGVLTLTGTATLAEYAAALASVRYNNSNTRPSLLARTVRFVVNDGNLNSAPFNRNITFTIDNYPPDIVGDVNGELFYSTPEDSPITRCLAVTDPENQTVAITSVTSLTNHGVTTFTGLCFTYTPTPNFNGTERVQITVCDNGSPSKCTSVVAVITVTPRNDPPVAINDNASTTEENPVTFNILTNDIDIDNAINPASIVLNPASVVGKGSFVHAGGGSVTFTPVTNFFGSVVINYTVKDVGDSISNSATITVNVTPTNDPPIAKADTLTTLEDDKILLTENANVLSNDTDVDGVLAVTQFTVTGSATVYSAGSQATIAGIGKLTITSSGGVAFEPNTNYNNNNSPVLMAMYTVSDGTASTTAALRIRVIAVNDNPVGVNETGADAFTTAEEDPILFAENKNVLDNDTDADSDPLKVTKFVISGTTYTIPSGGSTSAVLANIGTVTIFSTGNLTFVPVTNYNGTLPSITYTNSDGLLTGSATVTIIVTPFNDPPEAIEDVRSVMENNVLNSNVLTNDKDVDGNPLTVISFVVLGDGATYLAGNTAIITGIGSIVINANGSFTFTPDTNYDGPVPFITYTISDGSATASADLKITVVDVIDYPIATEDFYQVVEDNILNPNVLVNDLPEPGNTLTVTQFTIAGDVATYLAGATATITDVGTVNITSSGILTFDSEDNYNGPVPIITYTINDGTGTASTTITIDITGFNDPPDGVIDDTFSTLEDKILDTKNVLSNDIDVDLDPLLITQFTVPSDVTIYSPGDTATVAGIGKIVINANGSFSFIPALNYNNSIPKLVATYTVTDGTASDVADLKIRVFADNDGPGGGNDEGTGASSDPFTTLEDNKITLTDVPGANVLANDIDPENDVLTVTQFIAGGNTYVITADSATASLSGIGTLTIYDNGDLTFSPVLNFNGDIPTVTYTVSDGDKSATAFIKIKVVPVNDAPDADADKFTTDEDISIVLTDGSNVLDNDSDPDQFDTTPDALSVTSYVVPNSATVYNAGDTATVTGAGGIVIGKFVINTDGGFAFKPDSNYNNNEPGVLLATYTVTDNYDSTDQAVVAIRVIPKNDYPGGGNDTGIDNDFFKTFEEVAIVLADSANVLDNDIDPDGDHLTVTQFEINNVTYTINPGSSAAATIAGQGVVRIHDNGALEFVPALNFNGAVDTITYTMSDGLLTATSFVVIEVIPQNDGPTVHGTDGGIQKITLEDKSKQFWITLEDAEGDGITIGGGAINKNSNDASLLGMDSLRVTADTTIIYFTFIPEPNFNSTKQLNDPSKWTIEIRDTGVPPKSLFIPVNITVVPVNDRPYAASDTTATLEDVAKTINILDSIPTIYQYDYDIDYFMDPIAENKINPKSIDLDPTTAAEDKTVLILQGIDTVGTFTVIDTLGNVTFSPFSDFDGPTALANYTIKDFRGDLSDTVSILVYITPTNDAPVFTSRPSILEFVFEDSSRLVSREAAYDPDGDSITWTLTNLHGGPLTMEDDSDPVFGVFNYRFIPVPNYNGESTWELKACDSLLACTTWQFTIPIIPVNDEPVAVNDSSLAYGNTTTTFDVVINDLPIAAPYEEFYDIYADADSSDAVFITEIVKEPKHGNYFANADGKTISYTPTEEGYLGTDTIVYRICDSGFPSLCATGVWVITITYPNFKIYEGISPNGDHVNDYWRIDGIELEDYNDHVIRVFDRYSNLVYETTHYENEEGGNNWYGQATRGLGSGTLPEGTYYYTVYISKKKHTYSGYVYLKRN